MNNITELSDKNLTEEEFPSIDKQSWQDCLVTEWYEKALLQNTQIQKI